MNQQKKIFHNDLQYIREITNNTVGHGVMWNQILNLKSFTLKIFHNFPLVSSLLIYDSLNMGYIINIFVGS